MILQCISAHSSDLPVFSFVLTLASLHNNFPHISSSKTVHCHFIVFTQLKVHYIPPFITKCNTDKPTLIRFHMIYLFSSHFATLVFLCALLLYAPVHLKLFLVQKMNVPSAHIFQKYHLPASALPSSMSVPFCWPSSHAQYYLDLDSTTSMLIAAQSIISTTKRESFLFLHSYLFQDVSS